MAEHSRIEWTDGGWPSVSALERIWVAHTLGLRVGSFRVTLVALRRFPCGT